MIVLGVNAVFHDPAAALVIDGVTVAAAEEERFSRRKHGKPAVPFSTWELPTAAMKWCLDQAGLEPADLDIVAYSYDPDLAPRTDDVIADEWEGLRTLYARRAPLFLQSALPGLRPDCVRFVQHHLAHAASAALAAPLDDPAVLVLDGRGECDSHLAAATRDQLIEPLFAQALPHSLGLMYEDLTEHLGFHRSSDEYKVMALASYAEPDFLDAFRQLVRLGGDGGFTVAPIDWSSFVPPVHNGVHGDGHAALAASVQTRLEEIILGLASWVHDNTGAAALPWRAASLSTASPTVGSPRRDPSTMSGSSRPRVMLAPLLAPRSSRVVTPASGSPRWPQRRSAGDGAMTTSPGSSPSLPSAITAPQMSPMQQPRSSPLTALSGGSRAAASTDRVRSATAASWPARRTRRC